MNLKYFGTAAAEGIPALFCECDLCRFAKESGNKDIRTRSQAIIDNTLLIDFPADTYMHTLYGGLDLTHIHSCLITHNHSDHLYAADLEMRREGFSYLSDTSPITYYCSPKTSKDIENIIKRYHLDEQRRVLLQVIEPYRPYMIEGYTVTALKADHDPDCDPYIYLISDGKSRMLYGNDTGVFPDATWDYLKQEKLYLNYVSLDCTAMNLKGWENNHLSLDMDVKVKNQLTAINCADEHTVWCINHFSHNGGLNHASLERIAANMGFLTSYDGMVIDF